MSKNKTYLRRLERYRKALKVKSVPEAEGNKHARAKAAKVENFKKVLASKKTTSKLVQELEGLSVAQLNEQLEATRQELFNLRFKHAVVQLENVAAIPAAKRRIARILTLIKQKEVGA